MAQESTRETGNGGAWRAVFVIALVVLAASLAALGVIAYSYVQGQAKYAAVAREAGLDAPEASFGQSEEQLVDWDALLAANPDTVAWLTVPGTTVNYPVVQGPDNEYYLTHDFGGEEGWLATYGSVFLDCRNARDWSDQLSFVYGHHMNDGSMFAGIAALDDQRRFDECRTVRLLTPSGNFELRTFALVHVPADDAIVQTAFATGEDMEAYVQDKIDASVVDPGAIPAAADMGKVVALATCDNLQQDGRYILYAYV